MRTLKNIIIGLLVIIVILVIISFFLPSKAHVERSMIIHASPSVVFNEVNDLKKWEEWSPWHRMDPNMQITYSEVTSGAGASYTWKSDNGRVGNGTMKITGSEPTSAINTEMNFMENGVATGDFKFEPAEGGTKMTWGMNSDLGMNPLHKFFGLMMDKMVGPDFEKGMKTLDSLVVLENNAPHYDIQEITVTAAPSLTIKDSASFKDLSNLYMKSYEEIKTYMKKTNLTEKGAPFSFTYVYMPEKFVIEAGIPTDKMGKSSGHITAKNTPAGNAVMTKYYGDYSNMKTAYNALNEWIKVNNKIVTGAPWEVYVTDPGMEKDTAKWLTEIYFPVQ